MFLGVQAKHYRPEPPVGKDVVEKLFEAMKNDHRNITHGMVITTGAIGDDATKKAEAYYKDKNVHITLIDGEDLAALIVDHGFNITGLN